MTNAVWHRIRPRHESKDGLWLFRLAWASMATFGLVLWMQSVSNEVARLRDAPNRTQDYMSFYSAGKLVINGRGGEIYDLDAVSEIQSDLLGISVQGDNVLPYLNPPFVAVILAPLTLLSMSAVSAVLFALNVVLVVVCGVFLHKLIAPEKSRHAIFLWVAYLSAPTIFGVLLHLQFSMLALLAWLGFVHFQLRGKDAWSGGALALSLFKPQLIVMPLLFLCYRRRFAALAPIAAISAVLLGLSVVFAGPRTLIDYPLFLMASTSWDGQGIYIHSMFGWNALVADITGDPSPSSFLVGALVVPTLGLMLWQWWSFRETWRDHLLPLMGLTLTAALLTNLHLYLHDMVLLSLALALAASHSLRTSGTVGNWGVVTVAFWVLFLPIPGLQLRPGGLPLLTVAMAGLLLHFWSNLRRGVPSDAQQLPVQTERLAA